MADFKIGDKVKIIGGYEKQHIGKTGTILKDGGTPNNPAGWRSLGKGIKDIKMGRHLWVVLIDNTDITIVLPEDAIEKIA